MAIKTMECTNKWWNTPNECSIKAVIKTATLTDKCKGMYRRLQVFTGRDSGYGKYKCI